MAALRSSMFAFRACKLATGSIAPTPNSPTERMKIEIITSNSVIPRWSERLRTGLNKTRGCMSVSDLVLIALREVARGEHGGGGRPDFGRGRQARLPRDEN